MKGYYQEIGLGVLCGLFGKTRQAYYARSWREEKQRFVDSIVVNLVKEERKVARRVGGKRLHMILKSTLDAHGIQMGRDQFFEVLRAHGLLVKRRRRRQRTTFSRHTFRKYPNLTKDLVIDRAEQLWVSDITYIRVDQGFCYLILITDAYSRKVLGFEFSKTMEASFCLAALDQAINGRVFPHRKLMHHSDRGLQYCSAIYVNRLRENQIAISMTETPDPLENALAERMNGIFKDNFDIARIFSSFEQAGQFISKAVEYYNHRLPHSSCDMLTPNQAHLRTGVLKKHWKKSRKIESEK
ncbi:MAG: IS3 family transposase [Chlamydiota bacterium]